MSRDQFTASALLLFFTLTRRPPPCVAVLILPERTLTTHMRVAKVEEASWQESNMAGKSRLECASSCAVDLTCLAFAFEEGDASSCRRGVSFTLLDPSSAAAPKKVYLVQGRDVVALSSLRIETGAGYNDGLNPATSSLGFRLCYASRCCQVSVLSNSDPDFFTPSKVDDFAGAEMGECDGFLHDSSSSPTVTLTHAGSNLWKGPYAELSFVSLATGGPQPTLRCENPAGGMIELNHSEEIDLSCVEV